MATFGTLSDRLTETFRNLRTKGKLTPADVDGTVREIRRALLDADVALPVVKEFTAKVRERNACFTLGSSNRTKNRLSATPSGLKISCSKNTSSGLPTVSSMIQPNAINPTSE